MPKPLKSNAKAKADNDLFGAGEPKGRAPLKVASRSGGAEADYTARDIEVLEGLEPVRHRPGMYTRTDSPLHIVQEVIDNSRAQTNNLVSLVEGTANQSSLINDKLHEVILALANQSDLTNRKLQELIGILGDKSRNSSTSKTSA